MELGVNKKRDSLKDKQDIRQRQMERQKEAQTGRMLIKYISDRQTGEGVEQTDRYKNWLGEMKDEDRQMEEQGWKKKWIQ